MSVVRGIFGWMHGPLSIFPSWYGEHHTPIDPTHSERVRETIRQELDDAARRRRLVDIEIQVTRRERESD